MNKKAHSQLNMYRKFKPKKMNQVVTKINFSIVLISILMLFSCSNKIQILELKFAKKPTTSASLENFKNRDIVFFKETADSNLKNELNYLKNNINRQNIIPSSILYYAFVMNKDTIYAGPDFNYWFYNGKVQLYTSKVITSEFIKNL
ncbi:MAG: hypothetical protein ACOVLC_14460 [Flavobacterium sp.]